MNILRPLQMFISTLPILLALVALLVSATPIPSLDVSKGDTNALIVRGLPIDRDYSPVKTDSQRLNELMQKMFDSPHSFPDKDLLKDLRECVTLITPLTEAEAKDITPGIFMSIGRLKRFLGQCYNPIEGIQDIVREIKAFEDQAVAKGLPRWSPLFQPPKDLKGLLDGSEDNQFTETASSGQVSALHKLVAQVLSLTLTEYASIHTELKGKYEAIDVKIKRWKEGDDKIRAEKLMMGEWKAMGSLVDIFSAIPAKV
ncbi:hypothetical protein H0H93_009435 [Arthromyces matolae]|nr:hypothetical protein H0H93_009435 [Arthromyces matolae]